MIIDDDDDADCVSVASEVGVDATSQPLYLSVVSKARPLSPSSKQGVAKTKLYKQNQKRFTLSGSTTGVGDKVYWSSKGS